MMKKGFTLVEILVSLSIFALVMTISLGAILGVFTANRKAATLRVAMDSLNSSMEAMARELRFGTSYHCESTYAGDVSPTPQDCIAGGQYITFIASDGATKAFRQNGTILMANSGSGWFPLTDVAITNLKFYVFGAESASSASPSQPKVFVVIQGNVPGKDGAATNFNLQTLVSQRAVGPTS